MGFRLTIQGLGFKEFALGGCRVWHFCFEDFAILCAGIRAFHLVGLRFALQAIVGQGNTARRH